MTNTELNQILINTFPELEEDFVAYMNNDGDGMNTGCFLTHEDVLLPKIRASLDTNDKAFISRSGDYIEYLLSIHDDYAENVAIVGLIEGLLDNPGGDTARSLLGPKGRKEYDELRTYYNC